MPTAYKLLFGRRSDIAARTLYHELGNFAMNERGVVPSRRRQFLTLSV